VEVNEEIGGAFHSSDHHQSSHPRERERERERDGCGEE
jgi:hypothetical protein